MSGRFPDQAADTGHDGASVVAVAPEGTELGAVLARIADVVIGPGHNGAIPATWDLVGYATELTDRGGVQVAGKSGRKIEIKLDPSVSKAPREALAQRKWREGRSIEALAGSVVLDADTGAPLSVELDAKIGFSRDGRSFVMKLKMQSAITQIGKPAAIAAPAEGEVVATPGRLREVDDRDYLLQGIAPPIRKNADGTAATPQPVQPGKPVTP